MWEKEKRGESCALPSLSLSIYLPSVCLTFALCLVLCCASTVSVCSFDTSVTTVTVVYRYYILGSTGQEF